MKKIVSISVEKINYEPVKGCLDMLGRTFSDYVGACLGILARDLRQCDVENPVECVKVLDNYFDRLRALKG